MAKKEEGFDPFGKGLLSEPGTRRPPTAKHVATIETDYVVEVVDEAFHLEALGGGWFELWLTRYAVQFVAIRARLPGCSAVEAACSRVVAIELGH